MALAITLMASGCLPMPGSTQEIPFDPWGANSKGLVVGEANRWAVVFDTSSQRLTPLPKVRGWSSAAATDVNDNGLVVGLLDNSGRTSRAFVYSLNTKTYRFISYPGMGSTAPGMAINNKNRVLLVAGGVDPNPWVYSYASNTYTKVEQPDIVGTSYVAFSDSGLVAGTHAETGQGVLYNWSTGRYRTLPVDTRGNVQITDISPMGVAVGRVSVCPPRGGVCTNRPVAYDASGSSISMNKLPASVRSTGTARAVSPRGVIFGDAPGFSWWFDPKASTWGQIPRLSGYVSCQASDIGGETLLVGLCSKGLESKGYLYRLR